MSEHSGYIDKAKEAAGTAKEKAGDVLDKVEEKASELAETVKEKASDLLEKVEDKAEELSHKEGLVGKVAGAIDKGLDRVTGGDDDKTSPAASTGTETPLAAKPGAETPPAASTGTEAPPLATPAAETPLGDAPPSGESPR